MIIVSLYGQVPPDILQIALFAKSNSLVLIEDAAQSFGAERKEYKSCSCKIRSSVGPDEETDATLSSYLEHNMLATTSFFPTKY